MTDVFKKVELSANIAIIIVAILLVSVLIKTYLLPSNHLQSDSRIAPASHQGVEIGGRINVPDIDWQKNGQTLLLALSTTCHFCTESSPFYRQLAKAHGNTRLVALLPQDITEGRRYMSTLGVEVDEIKQISMGSLGIRGTPTLILVNSSGQVESTWEGALPADKENEVLSRLQSERASK